MPTRETWRTLHLAGAREWAGYRSAHFARSSGALIAVLHASEAGIDDDPETPWATLCDDHGSVLLHRTLLAARRFSACPEEWCEECRYSALAGPITVRHAEAAR